MRNPLTHIWPTPRTNFLSIIKRSIFYLNDYYLTVIPILILFQILFCTSSIVFCYDQWQPSIQSWSPKVDNLWQAVPAIKPKLVVLMLLFCSLPALALARRYSSLATRYRLFPSGRQQMYWKESFQNIKFSSWLHQISLSKECWEKWVLVAIIIQWHLEV